MRDWIEENCFTRAGGLNNRVALESWWVNRGSSAELDELRRLTSFLETDDITQRIWHVVNGPERPACATCGSPTTFMQFKSGYRQYCSLACSTRGEERNRKIGQNRDMNEIMKKVRATNLARHGVEHSFSRPEVIEKIVATKLDRYGTLNPAVEKIAATNLERYGATSWFGSETGKKRLRERMAGHGGSYILSATTLAKINDVDKLVEMNQTMSLYEIADHFGVMPVTIASRIMSRGHEVKKHPSRTQHKQRSVRDFIEANYSGRVIINDRTVISPLEIDVYLPDLNLGIEFNGAHWHSYVEIETAEQKEKHLRKLEACEAAGIRLIQIFETDWDRHPEAVRGLLRSAVRSYDESLRASKCRLSEVSYSEEKDFLNTYHLQGHAWSSTRMGLYDRDDRLLCLMTVGKPRYDRTADVELIRYCALPGVRVRGGASRILKALAPSGRMVSYCDRAYHSGGLYGSLGFRLERTTAPGYFYHKKTRIIRRSSAMKHKLPELLGDSFDPDLSEANNMFKAGYARYWNCGNSVWIRDFD